LLYFVFDQVSLRTIEVRVRGESECVDYHAATLVI